MKSSAVYFSFLLIVIACSNNSSKESNSPTAINESSNTGKDPSSSAPAGEGIVGTWKLRLEVFDDNGNRIPDDAEMKKGYSNNYHFQFNADGTCRIQQVYTGRYERKTENGSDKLYVYRKKIEGEEDKDPIPDVYLVTSLKKDELVLQIVDGGEPGSFWFFKRI